MNIRLATRGRLLEIFLADPVLSRACGEGRPFRRRYAGRRLMTFTFEKGERDLYLFIGYDRYKDQKVLRRMARGKPGAELQALLALAHQPGAKLYIANVPMPDGSSGIIIDAVRFELRRISDSAWQAGGIESKKDRLRRQLSLESLRGGPLGRHIDLCGPKQVIILVGPAKSETILAEKVRAVGHAIQADEPITDAKGVIPSASHPSDIRPGHTSVATRGWKRISGDRTTHRGVTAGGPALEFAPEIPRGRRGALSWTDSSAKMWLFGGGLQTEPDRFRYGCLNDLWTFDPRDYKWARVSGGSDAFQDGVYGTRGVDSPANIPAARESAVAWIDRSDNLWLFGGAFYGGLGALNDLWKFDPSTREWTWMSGSSARRQKGIYGDRGIAAAANAPGARSGAVSWIGQDGCFWLFGGSGLDSAGKEGVLNDLWKYDPVTHEWTWVSGGNVAYQDGVYGTLGIAAKSNVPGAREFAVSWSDPRGFLWLFGGDSHDSAGERGPLNDLWKYDPIAGEWTWMSGGNTINQPGVYGAKGVGSLSVVPRSRDSAVSWVGTDGGLWLFGGDVFRSPGTANLSSDLWKYDPATSEWMWVSGDFESRPTKRGGGGVLVSSVPGERSHAVSWGDSKNCLWLFGGYGLDAIGNLGFLNDLWRYDL